MPLKLRWFGVAGVEFSLKGRTLLIDPFFTRPSPWKMITLQRVSPNAALIMRYVHRADYVLVSHGHYDHLLDVPEVLRLTGARAYGSRNIYRLLISHGLPKEQLAHIRVGDRIDLEPFQVEVYPARHTRTPLDRWINGTSLLIDHHYALVDYRMDDCLAFGSTRQEKRSSPVIPGARGCASDRALSIRRRSWKKSCVSRAAGGEPDHWDNFTRPLSKPLRPCWDRPPGLAGWPPVKRMNLAQFTRRVEQTARGCGCWSRGCYRRRTCLIFISFSVDDSTCRETGQGESMDNIERAMLYHDQGYACSQAVLLAFAEELGLTKKLLWHLCLLWVGGWGEPAAPAVQ